MRDLVPADLAGQPESDVDEQALNAACLALPGVDRDAVDAALTAAHKVYAGAEQETVQRLLDATGLGGLDIDDGVRLRIKHAFEIAAAIVRSFDALLDTRGAQNYLEWECTVTDPAREQAHAAGVPVPELPAPRVYRITVTRPGRPTSHQLREVAESRLAAVVALARRGEVLDPDEVLAAAGVAE